MTAIIHKIVIIFFTAATLLTFLTVPSDRAVAQEEVVSSILRYKDRETSTGYYEEYEVIPGRHSRWVEIPGVKPGIFSYSPTAAQVRIRTRLVDSHMGIKFYHVLRCEYCHVEQSEDFHRVRANISCRQCHGGEPIASIQFFYSPMNPIRRHAYVCAKCHEGASASFASYVVHEPAAGSPAAKKDFPLLYYAYWFIFILLVGTLAFFIPHTFLTGVREVIATFNKPPKEPEDHDADIDGQDAEPGPESHDTTDNRQDDDAKTDDEPGEDEGDDTRQD